MSSRTTPAPDSDAPGEKLPLAVMLAYGAPGLASAMAMVPVGIHLTIFYTDTVLVPIGFIALVGFGFVAAIAWFEVLVFAFGLGAARPWVAGIFAGLTGAQYDEYRRTHGT